MNKKLLTSGLLSLGLLMSSFTAQAADYIIDTKGMHASIKFRVVHLGYSWLYGRFNQFNGQFSYDQASPEKTTLSINIDTNSVDSNHAERDKHLRGDDFLHVDKYPTAKFVSTGFTSGKNGAGVLTGNFTLNGVTLPLDIAVTKIGEGKDPWGGYRVGFEGKAKFTMADYGILKNLGPASKDVELMLSIEGVRKK